MRDPAFEIEITSQGWITDEPGSARSDLCSHGGVRLVIGGEVILPGDEDDDYTISTSALALLRTLESDHSPRAPVAEGLILHCGMLLMLSCPIGVDWSVRHMGGHVVLDDIVRVDTFDEQGTTRFPGLTVELPEIDYRRRIVAFAEKAKAPFDGVEKVLDPDDWETELYPKFWSEYNTLLDRHSRVMS